LNKLLTAVAAFALASASGAHAAWHEAKSKHFIIYANQAPDQLRAYAERLERFDQAVRYIRKMGDPALSDSGRVTIFAVTNDAAMAKLAGFNGVRGLYTTGADGSYAFVPQRSGMSMVQGMSGGTGTEKDNLSAEMVFFHEYAHHLQMQDWTQVMPVWVSEGFAEFFATAEIDKAGNVTIGKFPPYRSYEVFLGTGLTAEDLVKASFDRLAWYESISLYGRAWLLTHYLNMSDSRRGQLNRYLDELQKGTPGLQAGKMAFGDLKTLSKEIDAYAAPRNFMAFTIDGKVISAGNVTVRPLTEGETAVMPGRMRSKYGATRRTADEIAAQVRGAASKFPNDIGAQSSLAEAEYDAGNYAAAEAAADRVLAIDPKNVHGLIYKGRAAMKLGAAAPASADWNKIRSWFLAANKLDTENPAPLALYFKSFAAAGQAPTNNALESMLYAVDLAPQDRWLRVDAVRALLGMGKFSEASTLFAPLAFAPHAGKDWREQMPAIVAAINAGDAKQALALLAKAIEKSEKKRID
jgi:tetratricopeptide (TPR) repeat protein